VNPEMHFAAEIKVSSEIHLVAVMEQMCRFICRPRSSNGEIYSEVGIEPVWRCTRRP